MSASMYRSVAEEFGDIMKIVIPPGNVCFYASVYSMSQNILDQEDEII